MTTEQVITVDDVVVIQAINRLRAQGWRKVLGVDRDGKTYTLTTRKGEPQSDDAYDNAFLDAYRDEHFRLLNSKTISSPARS
jgi:hypothetical protein